MDGKAIRIKQVCGIEGVRVFFYSGVRVVLFPSCFAALHHVGLYCETGVGGLYDGWLKMVNFFFFSVALPYNAWTVALLASSPLNSPDSFLLTTATRSTPL